MVLIWSCNHCATYTRSQSSLPRGIDVQLSTNLWEVWPTVTTYKETQPISGYTPRKKRKKYFAFSKWYLLLMLHCSNIQQQVVGYTYNGTCSAHQDIIITLITLPDEKTIIPNNNLNFALFLVQNKTNPTGILSANRLDKNWKQHKKRSYQSGVQRIKSDGCLRYNELIHDRGRIYN